MGRRRALLIGIREYRHAPPLRGCHNDVTAMKEVLESAKYAFETKEVLDATRAELDAALAGFLANTASGDKVLFFYSGHGSFTEDPATGKRYESIVPADSGRGSAPNLDLFDLEIERFRHDLEAVTPDVTLIFDSCHSGHVTRAGSDARQVGGDRQPPGELLERLRELERTRPRPAGRRAVTLAACREFELAGEHTAVREDMLEGSALRELPAARFFGVTFGAFTFHLHHALAAAGEGRRETTWGEVLGQAARRVRRRRRRQNPRLLGDPDLPVFGLDDLERTPFLRVAAAHGDEVTLAGGAAHGVRAGARWQIRTRVANERGEGTPVAEVGIVERGATRSRARVVELAPGGTIAPTQRAFLLHEPADAPRLRVAIAAATPEADRLREEIERRPGLALAVDDAASDDAASDVEVTGATGAGAGWIATDAAGELAVRRRPQPGDADAVRELAADLEALARCDALSRLAPPASDPLRAKVSFQAARARSWEESFVPLPKTELLFEAGEEVEYEIVSHHDAPLWLNLVQFDSDAAITRLLPHREHSADPPPGQRLEPGERLRLPGDYWGKRAQGRGYKQEIPAGFPWRLDDETPAEPATECPYILRLFVTSGPADFRFVEQSAVRGSNPLATDEPWTVTDLEIVVRRAGARP